MTTIPKVKRDTSLDVKKDVMVFSRGDDVYLGMKIVEEWDPVSQEFKIPQLKQVASFGGSFCDFPTDPVIVKEFAEFLIDSYVPVMKEVILSRRSMRTRTDSDVDAALELAKGFRR